MTLAKENLAKAKLSARDYVHDGLIAIWDGIENFGYGIHDGESRVWKDLVRGREAKLTAAGSFCDNALVCNGLSYAAEDGEKLDPDVVKCVEVVYDGDGTGILAAIAGPGGTDGDIFLVKKTSASITCMCVNSIASGKKNVVSVPNGICSCSFVYDNRDLADAIINGQLVDATYNFATCACSKVSYGGRSEWTDIPFAGKMHCVRIYSRVLAMKERTLNYEIDKERFGI